ncbi:hypothetical protein [Polymorphobacter sp.]|uniref:hypothetical protein n=1 Tax=Polymorphobacter sp. TaxID=1909290 RepID=UPI003F71C68B
MRWFKPISIALGLALAAPAMAASSSDDALSKFFTWWNEAYKVPGSYTADNFRKHLTNDATLILEGKTVINGADQWATHFQKIQQGGGDVELVVPFKAVFQKDDMIYNYHVIRSRRDGKTECALAAGHAIVRGGKIASIVLVRADLDKAKGQTDPECYPD